MKVMLDEEAIMPTRAHETDAGMDLYTRYEEIVPARGYAIFDTGVHIEIPAGYVGFLKSKSGLNVKHHLTSDGVIDSGYTGSIVVKLYNNSEVPYIFVKGDKITQLVILPCSIFSLELVDEFKQTYRGNDGFGSNLFCYFLWRVIKFMDCCAYCGTEMELIKGIYYIADKLYCPKCKTYIYIHDDYENPVSYENCQVED